MSANMPDAPTGSPRPMHMHMPHLATAIEELLNPQPWTVAQAMDRHFGPGFRQRVQGTWVDRPTFAARLLELRALVERVTVTVLDELVNGEHYAERHVIDLRMKDGERVVREVYVFALLDPDGRFDRIEESTVVIELGP
jgi:hypothetical protein